MAAESPHFRLSARAPVALVVRFRKDDPRAALEHSGRTIDVSMAGVFVETERPPALGSKLLLTLVAPTAWEPLAIPAEVRWISEGKRNGQKRGFGAHFAALGASQAAALFELLAASEYLDKP